MLSAINTVNADAGGVVMREEEEVDYVMASPFADALPSGEYSHPKLLLPPPHEGRGSASISLGNCAPPKRRILRVHPRPTRTFDGLFADDVWPGSVEMADFLVEHAEAYVRGRRVLELGAGAALPSLVCCCLGASVVVSTDFPEESILQNIRAVLHENGFPPDADATDSIAPSSSSTLSPAPLVRVVGHAWGESVEPLLEASGGGAAAAGFDLVVLAELLWKDTAPLHGALLRSAASCLAPGGVILVSFGERPPPPPDKPTDADAVAEVAYQIREDDFIRLATSTGGAHSCRDPPALLSSFEALELLKRTDCADVCSSRPLTVRLVQLTERRR